MINFVTKTVAEHTYKRAERIGRSVRYGQKRLKRLSRAATLGGIFLSFLRIGTTGFGAALRRQLLPALII